MPTGLPTSASLNVALSQTLLLVPLPDAGEPTMPPRGLSPEEYGQLTWLKKHGDEAGTRDTPDLNRVLIGSRKTWTFTVELPTATAATFSVAEDSVPKGTIATTMDELPASVRRVLDKAYQDYLKSMEGGD